MAKKNKTKEDETKKVVAKCDNPNEVVANCENPQENSLSQYDIEKLDRHSPRRASAYRPGYCKDLWCDYKTPESTGKAQYRKVPRVFPF